MLQTLPAKAFPMYIVCLNINLATVAEVDSHKFVVIEVATDAPGWKDPSEDSNSVARD